MPATMTCLAPSELEMDIPSDILNFSDIATSIHNTATSSNDRINANKLFDAIKHGDKTVSGNLASWLEGKINDRRIESVIIMLKNHQSLRHKP